MASPEAVGPTLERDAPALRRVALAYLTDLCVSIALVVIVAGLLGERPNQESQVWIFDLRASIARFTPFGLWQVYLGQVVASLDSVLHGPAPGAVPSLLIGFQVVGQVVFAVPAAILLIYHETDTVMEWCALAGFCAIVLATFSLMICRGWISLVRLLIAAVASPVVAAILFWMVQQTLLDVLNGLAWFVSIGLWCLLCPLACTAYWVLFPHATQGAAARCIHLLCAPFFWTPGNARTAPGAARSPLTSGRKLRS